MIIIEFSTYLITSTAMCYWKGVSAICCRFKLPIILHLLPSFTAEYDHYTLNICLNEHGNVLLKGRVIYCYNGHDFYQKLAILGNRLQRKFLHDSIEVTPVVWESQVMLVNDIHESCISMDCGFWLIVSKRLHQRPTWSFFHFEANMCLGLYDFKFTWEWIPVLFKWRSCLTLFR